MPTYVEGQLSDLSEKSCEPIALANGIPPRTLQEFLVRYKWDHDLARQLFVARNVLDPSEVKFFVSNAPPETNVSTLLLVAFSRWRVERCFEDQEAVGEKKSGIGRVPGESRRRRPGAKLVA